MRRLFVLLSILAVPSLFLVAQIANHVVISEVSPMKGNSSTFNTGEYIELYNPLPIPVTLGPNVQIISGNTSGSNAAEWQLPLAGKVIAGYGYFLIGDGGAVSRDTSFPSSKNLANSGTRSCVQLRDGSTVIDAFAWDPATTPLLAAEGTRFSPSSTTTDGKSFERKSRSSATSHDAFGNAYDTNNNATDFFENSAANSNPDNSSTTPRAPFSGADTIPPTLLTLKTLSNSQLELTFNEAVDSATSSTSSNYIINKSVSVLLAARAANISKVLLTTSLLANDVYTLTIQNVKDTAGNAITTPIQVPFSYGTIPISQARAAGAGQSVRVRGILTVGNEFKSPSYLQDTTGGIAVFNFNFSGGAKAGDIWEVAGTLQDFHGLLEMNPLTDSLKISSGNLIPLPKIISSSQLGESYESQLVRINKAKFALSGSFGPSTSDSSYLVSDAYGTFTLNIDKDSNIPGTPIPADSVNIIGVVTQFNSGYQLLPRSIGDIGVIDPPPGQAWTDISIARTTPLGAKVMVRGIVTFNQPSSSASKTVFIQDATGGIALFDPATDTLQMGDSVQVRGVMSDFNNLAELKTIDTLALFGRGFPLPSPKIITAQQASEAYESQLVMVLEAQFVESGTFAGNTTYHLNDPGTEIDVRIPANSLLAGTPIPVGAIDAIGVLGQFQTKYQLTPRGPSDLIALPGPQIFGAPIVSGLSDNGFAISWTTLLDGSSALYYGSSQSLGDSLTDQTLTKTHTFTLSGLKSGRVYYCKILSANTSGTSTSNVFLVVTTSSASSGEMRVYFNYPTDATLGLAPPANGSTALIDKLLERISKATKTIDLALYSFDDFSSNPGVVSNRVADSLLSAKNRGVTVRMVFDNKSTTTPLGKLIAGGISVIKRSVPGIDNGIMHNKFFIFDGRDTTSATDDWVLTGSWNVTNEGTLSDAQNAIFIQDQSLARIYTLEFEEMFGSSTDVANSSAAKFGPTKRDNTPHLTYIAGKRVEVFFSPSDQTTSNIITALSTADRNIFFGILAFTRTDIASTLIAKKNAGVIVRGMIDQQPSVLGTLQAAGVDALQAGHSVVTGLFHHKYGVIDPYNDESDPIVITGSHNWSSAAETDNDENTIIIHSGDIARQYVQEFSKRYKESGGTGPVLSVEKLESAIPMTTSLSQNYPNPFNPTTNFELHISRAEFVSLKVFDVLGREVATLLSENKTPGVYKVSWDASTVSSGMYLYRFQAGDVFLTRKMLLVR